MNEKEIEEQLVTSFAELEKCLNEKFDKIHIQFDKIDNNLDQIHKRLDKIELNRKYIGEFSDNLNGDQR